jgi:hypothetical protein
MEQYVTVDERGIPWLKGTNTKVVEVVLDHIAHGGSSPLNDTVGEFMLGP